MGYSAEYGAEQRASSSSKSGNDSAFDPVALLHGALRSQTTQTDSALPDFKLENVAYFLGDGLQNIWRDLTQQPREIQWKTDLYNAYKEATTSGKPLVVEFSTEWCKYCQLLNDTTLKSNEVKDYSGKAVWARVDAEKDDANHNVSSMLKALGVDRYPTVVVLDVSKKDANGNPQITEVGRIVGYYDGQKFAKKLSELMPAGKGYNAPQDNQVMLAGNDTPAPEARPQATPVKSDADQDNFGNTPAYYYI